MFKLKYEMDVLTNKKVQEGIALIIFEDGGVYIFKTTRLEEQTQLFKL